MNSNNTNVENLINQIDNQSLSNKKTNEPALKWHHVPLSQPEHLTFEEQELLKELDEQINTLTITNNVVLANRIKSTVLKEIHQRPSPNKKRQALINNKELKNDLGKASEEKTLFSGKVLSSTIYIPKGREKMFDKKLQLPIIVGVVLSIILIVSSITPPFANLDNPTITLVVAGIGLSILTTCLIGGVVNYFSIKNLAYLNHIKNQVANNTDVDDLRNLLTMEGDFRAFGIREFHRRRPDLEMYLQTAEPGSEIKILGTALMRFNSFEAQAILQQKLSEGCTAKLLALNPNSEFVRKRGEDENRTYDDIKGTIQGTNSIINLFLAEKLNNWAEQKIEFRTYDTNPNIFLISTGSIVLVGFYLQNKRGEETPHFVFDIKEGGLSQSFLEHFDALWEASSDK